MTREDIKNLRTAISARGLQGALRERVELIRPSTSPDTYRRAWKVEDWEGATDTLRMILEEAQKLKIESDERIEAARKELELAA